MPLSRVVDLLTSAQTINDVKAGAAAVTSANAIRAWQKLGIDAASLSRPLYAVGERTGQTARDAGFGDIRIGGGDGASLAGKIRQDIHSGALEVSAAAPLLYVAGRTRHPQFETALAADKIPYRLGETYDMAQVSYSTDLVNEVFLKPESLAVLLYSRKAAELFFLAVSPDSSGNLLNKCEFFCMSANVVNAIPTQFRNQAVAATHPDENHLLSLLDQGDTMS